MGLIRLFAPGEAPPPKPKPLYAKGALRWGIKVKRDGSASQGGTGIRWQDIASRGSPKLGQSEFPEGWVGIGDAPNLNDVMTAAKGRLVYDASEHTTRTFTKSKLDEDPTGAWETIELDRRMSQRLRKDDLKSQREADEAERMALFRKAMGWA